MSPITFTMNMFALWLTGEILFVKATMPLQQGERERDGVI